MTSRTKGTVYRLTLTFPLCINPLNLIYHTFLLNDRKMIIFLLLSRLWWGAFSPPFRKISNGSQSCRFTFACTVATWAPCEGLLSGGQQGTAPFCVFPWAKSTGCHKVRDTTLPVTPLSSEPFRWRHSELGHGQLCHGCMEAVFPTQDRGCSSTISHGSLPKVFGRRYTC